MADSKVTALLDITTLGTDDNFYVVDDPGGTPVSRKVTGSVVKNFILAAPLTITANTDAEVTHSLLNTSTGTSSQTSLLIRSGDGTQANLEYTIDHDAEEVTEQVTGDFTIASTRVRLRTITSDTNTVIIPLELRAESSGAPAAGIGCGINLRTETAADNHEIGTVLESVTTDVTATAEYFDFVVKNMAAGAAAAEKLRVTAVGKLATEFTSTHTNTVASTVVHRHTTTGTAANGIGQAMVFEQDTGTANYEQGFVINTIFEDTTSTSEDSAVRLDTMVAGAVTTAQWVNRVKRTSTDHSVATSVATEVTELLFPAVQPGTYGFRYYLLNQSASTAAGLGFGLHFTGTASQFRAMRRYAGTTSLANGIAGNGTTSTITGQYQNTHACSVFASTTTNMMNTGVQAVNTDHMEVIEGMMTVTAAGNFALFHASEVATTTRVSSNSIAFLERYA